MKVTQDFSFPIDFLNKWRNHNYVIEASAQRNIFNKFRNGAYS